MIAVFNNSKYTIKKYQKDQIIHLQNEVCNNIDIVLKGQVSVQNIVKSGNILTINIFSPRDILGANLIFSHRNCYPMTVVSMSDSMILHVNKELVLELCKNNQNFLVSLMTEISDRTLILTDKINTISLKTIRQNIVEFLKYEHYIQKNNVIKLNMSKKDFAERLGVQRSSLSRELNKMKKDGLIEFNSKTITIKNID